MQEHPEKKLSARDGSLLIDALLAVVIFGSIAAAFGSGIFHSQEGARRSGDRIRASYLAEEALAGIRSIRDQSGYDAIRYRSLNQDDGVQLSNGAWTIVDDATLIDSKFTRAVQFAKGTSDSERSVTVTVSWTDPSGGTRSLSVNSYISNYREDPPPNVDWSNPVLVGNVAFADDSFEDVAIGGPQGTGAYVVGNSKTGSGFYVFDIGDPSNPVLEDWAHINAGNPPSSYDAQAWKIVINNTHAFVGSNSTDNKKIKILDITKNDITCCKAQIDLGTTLTSGEVRGLAVSGTSLYATRQPASVSADYREFMRYDISTIGAPTADGTINDDSLDMYDIVLGSGSVMSTGALVAADDPEELALMDIGGTTLEQLTGEDVTGTYEGYSVALYNTGGLVGTKGNNSAADLFSFDLTTTPPTQVSSFDVNASSFTYDDVYDIAISKRGEAALLSTYRRITDGGHSCSAPDKYQKHYFIAVDISNIHDITSASALLYNGSDFDSVIGCKERGHGIAIRESDQTAVMVTGNDFSEATPSGSLLVIQPTFGF